MSGVTTAVATVLAFLAIALGVRLLVQRVSEVSYSVVLVTAGLGVSLLGLDAGIELSHDLIVAVVLPTLLFNGAVELDVDPLREAPLVPVTLVVVGLPAAVALLGIVGAPAFGFPVFVSLLFAAMVSPTDPAAVLSLFEELGAPDELAALIESESLLNDGVAIVIFGSALALVRTHQGTGAGLDALLTAARLGGLAFDIAVVGGGGLLVGAAVGAVADRATRLTDEPMESVLVTVIAAYGSYLLAEHVLGLSGVLATVGAGLLMGAGGAEFTERAENVRFMRNVWNTAAFLVSTLVYLLIGAQVRVNHFEDHLVLVAIAAALVVAVRAVVVYPLLGAINATTSESVDAAFQHALVWGGLHTVVPVALVVSLPEGVPHRQELRTMVFGVAIVGTLVQGTLMPALLRQTGLTD